MREALLAALYTNDKDAVQGMLHRLVTRYNEYRDVRPLNSALVAIPSGRKRQAVLSYIKLVTGCVPNTNPVLRKSQPLSNGTTAPIAQPNALTWADLL